jgi:hypothetical protein
MATDYYRRSSLAGDPRRSDLAIRLVAVVTPRYQRGEPIGSIDAPPGESGQFPAKVSVRGGLRVDRPCELEIADDRGGAQV